MLLFNHAFSSSVGENSKANFDIPFASLNRTFSCPFLVSSFLDCTTSCLLPIVEDLPSSIASNLTTTTGGYDTLGLTFLSLITQCFAGYLLSPSDVTSFPLFILSANFTLRR
ncbi:hypothetical protein SLE2022_263080 [Rubroshorea leprosula]